MGLICPRYGLRALNDDDYWDEIDDRARIDCEETILLPSGARLSMNKHKLYWRLMWIGGQPIRSSALVRGGS